MFLEQLSQAIPRSSQLVSVIRSPAARGALPERSFGG
jgi:hypothetical protein